MVFRPDIHHKSPIDRQLEILLDQQCIEDLLSFNSLIKPLLPKRVLIVQGGCGGVLQNQHLIHSSHQLQGLRAKIDVLMLLYGPHPCTEVFFVLHQFHHMDVPAFIDQGAAMLMLAHLENVHEIHKPGTKQVFHHIRGRNELKIGFRGA